MAPPADALALTALVALAAAIAPDKVLAEVTDAAMLAVDAVDDATVDAAEDAMVDAAEDTEDAELVDAKVEEAVDTPAEEAEALEVAAEDDAEAEDAPDGAPAFKAELGTIFDEFCAKPIDDFTV